MRIASTKATFALTIAALALALAMPGVAAAQPADAPYESPMREQCEAELEKDARWQAELKQELRPVVHEEEAQSILNNKRHVVMAYAALWIIVVAFVISMWIRQRKLVAEIARLERDVERASRET